MAEEAQDEGVQGQNGHRSPGSPTASSNRAPSRTKDRAQREKTPVPVHAREKEVERLQGIIQHLKRETVTLRNKNEQEERRHAVDVEGLRKVCHLQREKVEKQKEEIHALEVALRDYRYADSDQQRTLAKTNTNAEAQIHRFRMQMAQQEQSHEQAQAQMQQQVNALRKERAAMCLGLAAVAQQSIGGPEASADDLAADAAAAVADQEEPIPRDPSAWSQLRFNLDDAGNLASFSRAPSSHLRPFDRDGARAVAALCAQVARLFRQRGVLRARLSRSTAERSKQAAQERSEFAVVRDLVGNLQKGVEELCQACSVPIPSPKPSSPAVSATLSMDRRTPDPSGAAANRDGTNGTLKPLEEGKVKELVQHLASVLEAAQMELHALRQGPSPPPKRKTPMASRGRLIVSPAGTKAKSGIEMYKEASMNVAAVLRKELVSRTGKQPTAPPSPPKTAPSNTIATGYTAPIKLATKPSSSSASTTAAAASPGLRALRGGQQPSQQQQQQQQYHHHEQHHQQPKQQLEHQQQLPHQEEELPQGDSQQQQHHHHQQHQQQQQNESVPAELEEDVPEEQKPPQRGEHVPADASEQEEEEDIAEEQPQQEAHFPCAPPAAAAAAQAQRQPSGGDSYSSDGSSMEAGDEEFEELSDGDL